MGELKKYYSQDLFQGKHRSFRMSNKQNKNQNSNDVRFGDWHKPRVVVFWGLKQEDFKPAWSIV